MNRWLEDPDAPAGVVDLLHAAQAEAPSAASLVAIRAGVDGGAAVTGSAGLSTLPLGKLLLALAGGAVIVAAVTVGAQRRERPRATPPTPSVTLAAHAATEEPAPAVAVEVPVPPTVPTASPAANPEPTPKAAKSRAAKSDGAVRPRAVARVESQPPDELGLIADARTALNSGAWTTAFGATVRHARHFPRGALAEEREAIAIEALVHLGRKLEAARRLESFARRFPSSAYRARLNKRVVNP